MTDPPRVMRGCLKPPCTLSDPATDLPGVSCYSGKKPKSPPGTCRFFGEGADFRISMLPRDPSMTEGVGLHRIAMRVP